MGYDNIAYHRAYYQAHKEKWLQYNRETRAIRRKCHLCIACGHQDAYTLIGRQRCAECVRKNTEYCRNKRGYKERPAPQDRPEKPWKNRPRGANGYCWQCNKEQAMQGRNLCRSCYEKKVETIMRYNEGRKKA